VIHTVKQTDTLEKWYETDGVICS